MRFDWPNSRPLVNGAGQDGHTLETDGWLPKATVLREGTVIAIACVNATDQLSHADTGVPQRFLVPQDVNSDYAGRTTVPIWPSIVASGHYQNCTERPADNAMLVLVSEP